MHVLRFQHKDDPSHDGEGLGGPDSFYCGVIAAREAIAALGVDWGVVVGAAPPIEDDDD